MEKVVHSQDRAEKRDQFIGVRFSLEEKEIIDKYVQKKNISYNEFLRAATFSFLNNLEKAKNKIDIGKIDSTIKNMKELFPYFIRIIHDLDKEFVDFRHSKDTYFIT